MNVSCLPGMHVKIARMQVDRVKLDRTVAQSHKAVTAYFPCKQIWPFGFVEQTVGEHGKGLIVSSILRPAD